MSPIRIRVLKITAAAHQRHFWYSNMVGQCVPLEGDEGGFWKSREPNGLVNFVAKHHATAIWVRVNPAHLHRYPYCCSPEARANTRKPEPAQSHRAQSRKASAIETAANIGIGFAVSLVLTALVMPLFGHHVTASQNVAITSIFTVASLLRSYAVRRMFNRMQG